MNKEKLILSYKKLKEQLDKQRSSETLKKYKILSKAYKLGKQIYGKNNFSIWQLALDFELPYSTTKRILALNKANKNTWKLINEGKISAFKVAMVLLKKDSFYQDETIKMVIEENLSTYQIKSLKIKNLEDIQKERLRLAVENGFARASTAWYSFRYTLERLNELLIMDTNMLPKSKLPELKNKIKDLKQKLEKYMENIE